MGGVIVLGEGRWRLSPIKLFERNCVLYLVAWNDGAGPACGMHTAHYDGLTRLIGEPKSKEQYQVSPNTLVWKYGIEVPYA
jgi:hypothetical protein